MITTAQSVSVNVTTSNAPILNFCANNYLGLSSHPAVIQAAIDALNTHGAGVSSVRWGYWSTALVLIVCSGSYVAPRIYTRSWRTRYPGFMAEKTLSCILHVLMLMLDYLNRYVDLR